ncbi:MAG: PLP-dependent transferase, partial [Alphaproteobacteria bacterium]
MKKSKSESWSETTKLTHLGRNPDAYFGLVNPPIARTSTILYPDLEAYENPAHQYRYGRLGNPLSHAFEQALAELEGGAGAVGTQTGLSAITTAILSIVKTGDHILMVDTVYPPVRDFCKNILGRMGVEVEYYDPCLGEK